MTYFEKICYSMSFTNMLTWLLTKVLYPNILEFEKCRGTNQVQVEPKTADNAITPDLTEKEPSISVAFLL